MSFGAEEYRLHRHAQVLLSQRQFARAEDLLRRLLSLDPFHRHATRDLAYCLCEQRKLDESADQARAAIALDPECPAARFTLARTLHIQERYEECLTAALETLQLEPCVSCYYWVPAATYYELRRPAEGIAYAEQGLAVNALDPDCQRQRALALGLLGREPEAREAVNTILSREPDHVWAHTAAGWVLWHLRAYDEAAAHLLQALGINPMEDWAHEGLGLVRADQQRWGEARHHLHEALARNPWLHKARAALARAAAMEGAGG